jgi:hypothetical protein
MAELEGYGLFVIPHLLANSFLLAGLFRHAFKHPDDLDLGQEPRWIQLIYSIGLSTLSITILITSFWGWPGASSIGTWWLSMVMIILSFAIYFTFNKIYITSKISQFRISKVKPVSISTVFWSGYRTIRNLINLITNVLEGDGGILWSIVLLVLFISLITQLKP